MGRLAGAPSHDAGQEVKDMTAPTRADRSLPLLAVVLAVVLNVLAAVVLKQLADGAGLALVAVVFGIGLAIALSGMRFLVWGYAHKRLPLSTSYPLTSIFFPVMLVVSWWGYGEPTRWTQIAGAALITLGVFWLAWRAPDLIDAANRSRADDGGAQ
jgi:drug/metabolite transporter (DMT)-like permease